LTFETVLRASILSVTKGVLLNVILFTSKSALNVAAEVFTIKVANDAFRFRSI
jgi:hypothetical protein